MIRKKGYLFVYTFTALFFAGLWLFGSTGFYSDSHQYIAMHIHREPLYPFFLWIFRILFKEEHYLEVVRFLQNVLAAYSVIRLTACLRREFQMGTGLTAVSALLLLLPHVITPLASETHLTLSNGILSEALGLPLYYLFFSACLSMIFGWTKRRAMLALLYAFLLSLTRGQMMAAILLWMVTVLALQIGRRAKKQAALTILCVVLAFGGRTLLVRSYNYVFNGYFINNTFGTVGLLANVLYAADREDGERIAEDEARDYFYYSYDLAMERGANYRCAPEGFLARAAHLEQWHDPLKFEIIEEPWRGRHDAEGLLDYIPENVESDRLAGVILKAVWPAVFGRWLYDYLALSVYGLIRTVAFVHPILNLYALLVYLFVAVGAGYVFWRRRDSKAARFAAFALTAVAANVYSTSLLIMCLSRYMIYAFPAVYLAALLLCREGLTMLRRKGIA